MRPSSPPIDAGPSLRQCASADELRALLSSLKRDFRSQASREHRQLDLSKDSLARRRQWAAGDEAAEWGLLALNQPREVLLGRAHGTGATAAGMRRLGSILRASPERAALSLYERLAVSCDDCANTGYIHARRRCRCFRGQVLPAYRCSRCHDDGMVEGPDGAFLCECSRKGPRRWVDSVLITESLVWDLPATSREAVERFLQRGEGDLKQGALLWVVGGQDKSRPGVSPGSYAGYGAARLCADRVQALGMKLRRVTPLDLLDEYRRGAGWFEAGEAILLDRPESALPTRELRQAIELLLASAWEWCGFVIVATELPLAPPESGRPSWRQFVERALAVVGPECLSTMRDGLLNDPGCAVLGELHPLMLRQPCSDDYLTNRARSLIARIASGDQQPPLMLAA